LDAASGNPSAEWKLMQTISAGLPSLGILLAAIVTVGACLHSNPIYALEAMDDTEMGSVTGQKGILLSLQYYYNSSHVDEASTSDFNEAGAPLIGADGCSTPDGNASLGNMNCRFAMQLKNRESEWLVFKNGYASLDLDRIALDASVLGASAGAGSTYTGWFNEEKFRAVDPDPTDTTPGPCLLEGDCTAATIADMAALRLSYPEGENGANFGNVRFGMFFEGLAVEPNAGPPNGNGWEGNQNGSFMGLNIADNNGHQARIAFGGDFYLYGF